MDSPRSHATVVAYNSQSAFGDEGVAAYLHDIKTKRLLGPEEEQQLSRRIRKGDEAAKEELINANLRLVVKIAKHYISNKLSLMDLIQEGNLGLIKAAEKFDDRKGCRFSTYASWWIRHSIIRSLAKKGRAVRIPYRKEECIKKIDKVSRQLSHQLNRTPTSEEIAEEMNMGLRDVEDIMTITQPAVSLEAPINDDDYMLQNTIGANTATEPERIVLNENLRDATERMLKTLLGTEEMIIRYRFGLYNGEHYTLQKTSRFFGVSAETIRQIEARALRKLRIRNRHLQDYLKN